MAKVLHNRHSTFREADGHIDRSYGRSEGEPATADKRELGSTSPKYSLLFPLLYAPLLPLTIIGA